MAVVGDRLPAAPGTRRRMRFAAPKPEGNPLTQPDEAVDSR